MSTRLGLKRGKPGAADPRAGEHDTPPGPLGTAPSDQLLDGAVSKPEKRLRVQDSASPSGAGGAGGGGSGASVGGGCGGSGEPDVLARARPAEQALDVPDDVPASSALDPGAFDCPCGPCAYDCQKRAPVRSPCGRLLCRKCAMVLTTQPDPGPCTLCGGGSHGPCESADFKVDAGVLLALMEKRTPVERYV